MVIQTIEKFFKFTKNKKRIYEFHLLISILKTSVNSYRTYRVLHALFFVRESLFFHKISDYNHWQNILG